MLAGCGLPAVAAGAPPPPASARPVQFRLGLAAELHSIYDDNLFRLPESDLRAYRSGSAPPRPGVESLDDLILSPRVSLELARRQAAGRESTLRVGYRLWHYASNRERRADQWFLRLQRPVGRAQGLELNFAFSPAAYLQAMADGDPASNEGAGGGWLPYRETRHAGSLAFMGRVSRRLGYRFEGEYVARSYDEPFAADAAATWSGAASAALKLSSACSGLVRYQRSENRARQQHPSVNTTAESARGDASWNRDLFQQTLVFQTRPGFPLLRRVELGGQQQFFRYTSRQGIEQDPSHAGRRDVVLAFELRARSRPILGRATLETGWRETRGRSSWTVAVDEAPAPEARAYADSRLWLAMTYTLENFPSPVRSTGKE